MSAFLITLEAARINAGFTQKEIADKIGVRVETVSSWENGRTQPKAIQLRSLCKLYGVNMNHIFLGKR